MKPEKGSEMTWLTRFTKADSTERLSVSDLDPQKRYSHDHGKGAETYDCSLGTDGVADSAFLAFSESRASCSRVGIEAEHKYHSLFMHKHNNENVGGMHRMEGDHSSGGREAARKCGSHLVPGIAAQLSHFHVSSTSSTHPTLEFILHVAVSITFSLNMTNSSAHSCTKGHRKTPYHASPSTCLRSQWLDCTLPPIACICEVVRIVQAFACSNLVAFPKRGFAMGELSIDSSRPVFVSPCLSSLQFP